MGICVWVCVSVCIHACVSRLFVCSHPTSSNNTQNLWGEKLFFSILNPGGLGRAPRTIPMVQHVFKDQMESGHNFLPGQEWTCDSSHVTKNQSHWNHKAFVKVMKKWRAVHSLMLLLSLRACTAKAATTVRKLVFHSTCLAISVKNFYGCFSPPYFATYSLFRVS